MRKEYRELNDTVYPSTEKTLSVIKDNLHGGCSVYYAVNSAGFENGNIKHIGTEQQIRFLKTEIDGTVVPGLLNEQVVLILLDRMQVLDKKFPCAENKEMIQSLKSFLAISEKRAKDRINRNVIGKQEK